MKRLTSLCAVLVFLVMPILYGCGGDSSPNAGKKTTVLVFMVGSNLESGGNLGTENIAEMTAVGSTDSVKVVVTTGGSDKEGWRTVKRHEVRKDALVTLSDQGDISMGDPATLRDFITWGMNAYPADRYVLVLWDHGGGAIGGFGSDDMHNDERLSLPKLRKALADAYSITKKSFELIGFDACLMANTETAFSIKPYARYLAASEDLEPGEGWDYTGMLQYLTTHTNAADGAALGKAIADSYKKKIDELYKSKAAITFSIIDLNRLTPSMETALEAFASRIQGYLSQGRDGWVEVAFARSRSYDFATSRIGGSFCDMVDLKDMALNMKSLAPAEATSVQTAVENAVIYKVQTLRPKAYGLTIYFPTGSIRSSSYNKSYQTLDFFDSYKAMVARYIAIGIEDISPPVFSGEIKNGDRFSATVAGGDVESVSAFISKTDDSGNLVMLGLNPVNVGQGGAVSMDWTGTWLSLNGVPVSAFVEVPGDTYETLSIPVLLNGRAALLIVTHAKDTGVMHIDGVWPGLEAKDFMAERTLIPLNAGDRIAPGFQVYDSKSKKITIQFGDAFTLADPITLASAALPAGDYSVAFFASDLAFNNGWSSTVTFSAGVTAKSLAVSGQPTRTDPAYAAAVSEKIRLYWGR
jgi:hypothetical protein